MEAPNPLPQHATEAASAPVGSIDHILRGVLSDVLSSADHQLAAAAATAGDEVLEEGRQVSQPLSAVPFFPFLLLLLFEARPALIAVRILLCNIAD